jgi:amino acid transporter
MDSPCEQLGGVCAYHLLLLVAVAVACMQYWDSISCLAGEVDNPSRTFPRALLWAVLLVVASYFLPTLAALGVAVDTADWQLGYYGKVAQQVCSVQPKIKLEGV